MSEETQFIGHGDELKRYQDWLITTDPQEPTVLFFSSLLEAPEKQGGIGKSWLLRECARLTKAMPYMETVMLDFSAIQDRSGLEITRRIITALRNVYPDWEPVAFQALFAQGKPDDSKMEAPARRHQLRAALLKDLKKLPAGEDKVRKHVIVFCDTYEQVEIHPSQLSLTTDHLFPDFYDLPQLGFVIAGRNPPDEHLSNWRGRMQQVQMIPVPPFTLAEMSQYLDDYLDFDGRQFAFSHSARLHELTEGRPILVGLLADMLNHHVVKPPEVLLTMEPESFQRDLVERINHLESELTTSALLFMAHIRHRFNREILDTLFRQYTLYEEQPEEERKKIWEQLKTFSFVRASATSDEIVLHDDMCALITRWIWSNQDKEMRGDLSKSMLDYYDERLAEVKGDYQLREAYTVERLYHECYLNLKDGFRHFRQLVEAALDRQQNIYARSLIREMDEFARRLSPEQSYYHRIAEARLLQNEELPDRALVIYDELLLLPTSSWLQEQQRARLFYEKGICLTALSRYIEALGALNRALELYDKPETREAYANAAARLGFVYRKFGDFSAAERHYNGSIEIHLQMENIDGYSDTLNALSEVYLLQGRLDEALFGCTTALKLRSDLYREGKATRLGLAYVLGTLGRIYYAKKDIGKARECLEKARDYYGQMESQRGIGLIAYYFGCIALDNGRLEEAEVLFQQARYVAAAYPEIEIMSLLKLGQMSFQQQKKEQALLMLGRAQKLAEDISDHYQRVEASLYRASQLLNLFPFAGTLPLPKNGLAERSVTLGIDMLESAQALAHSYRYHQLLGWIMKVHGDWEYRKHHLEKAFWAYVGYCQQMALYDDDEFSRARRFVLNEALKRLPIDAQREMLTLISREWDARDLPVEKYDLMVRELVATRLLLDLA